MTGYRTRVAYTSGRVGIGGRGGRWITCEAGEDALSERPEGLRAAIKGL
jgi:hypothetical protein